MAHSEQDRNHSILVIKYKKAITLSHSIVSFGFDAWDSIDSEYFFASLYLLYGLNLTKLLKRGDASSIFSKTFTIGFKHTTESCALKSARKSEIGIWIITWLVHRFASSVVLR